MNDTKLIKLEQELQLIKTQHRELLERCNSQGKLIVEMKDKYDKLLVEIKILKEGGNL